MDIELIHKPNKNNAVLDVLSCKEELPRGKALGEYLSFPSHVHRRKQFKKKDTRNTCGKLFGAKLF